MTTGFSRVVVYGSNLPAAENDKQVNTTYRIPTPKTAQDLASFHFQLCDT